MIRQPDWPRRFAGSISTRLAVLFLVVFLPCAQAAAPGRAAAARPAMAAAPLLAQGSLLSRFFHFFQSKLGSRARIVQFGAIGMCVGLFILMRKK